MKFFTYRYLPLNIYLAYSVFVFACLFVAPIEYRKLNVVALTLYVMSILFLFSVGYIKGARGQLGASAQSSMLYWSQRAQSYREVRNLLGFLLLAGLLGAAVQGWTVFSGQGIFDLRKIGDAYVQGYEGYERGQANVDFAYVLDIFRQAFGVLAVLIGSYYYRIMGNNSRRALVLIILAYLLINLLGTGKQKYLGDLVVFFAYCVMINAASNGRWIRAKRLTKYAVAALVVFALFIEILRQRYVAAGIDLENINRMSHPLVSWDENSLLFDMFGEEYGFALANFLGYFTNGLYGLYLSLTLPFEWSYFVGNSYSLGRIIEIVIGEGGLILERTYPYRVGLEYGWDLSKWHSLFAWLASDLTFLGVVFLAPAFGYFYGRTWIGAVTGKNAFAGPLFMFLSLGLVFSYANNQIMHALSGVIVLSVLLLGWFLHEKWNVRETRLAFSP